MDKLSRLNKKEKHDDLWIVYIQLVFQSETS